MIILRIMLLCQKKKMSIKNNKLNIERISCNKLQKCGKGREKLFWLKIIY